jgi:hypothetical protein
VEAAAQGIERLERQLLSFSERVNGSGPRFDAVYVEFEQWFRGTVRRGNREGSCGFSWMCIDFSRRCTTATDRGSIPSMRLAMPSRPSCIRSANGADAGPAGVVGMARGVSEVGPTNRPLRRSGSPRSWCVMLSRRR